MSKSNPDPGLSIDDQVEEQETADGTMPPNETAPAETIRTATPEVPAPDPNATKAPSCPSCGEPMEFVKHSTPPFAIYRCRCGLRRSMLAPNAGNIIKQFSNRPSNRSQA